MEAVKPERVVDKDTIRAIYDRQGCCLVGFSGEYDSCSGEDCMHHIKSRGSGGPDAEGNLIRVCLHHHQQIHNGLIPKKVLYSFLEEFDDAAE